MTKKLNLDLSEPYRHKDPIELQNFLLIGIRENRNSIKVKKNPLNPKCLLVVKLRNRDFARNEYAMLNFIQTIVA